jgi:gamma-glutamylcyclotransferase (GGCT)/AIG2-like uncharacterized protein YtfP
MPDHLPFFAYGTLRRGQCRQSCWPYTPQRVEIATLYGRLLDLGTYPGLVSGDLPIRGELWYFLPTQIAETCRVIDVVEGVNLGDETLYVRKVVTCLDTAGQSVQAYAYLYLQPHFVREIPLNSAGYVDWIDYHKSPHFQGDH